MGFQRKLAFRAVVIVAAVCGAPLSRGADELIHYFNDPAFNFTIRNTNPDYVAEWTQNQDPNRA